MLSSNFLHSIKKDKENELKICDSIEALINNLLSSGLADNNTSE